MVESHNMLDVSWLVVLTEGAELHKSLHLLPQARPPINMVQLFGWTPMCTLICPVIIISLKFLSQKAQSPHERQAPLICHNV